MRKDAGRRNGPAQGAALFADLYREHRKMLIAYAAGPLGWADAEDVVQDAFETLWRNGWEPHEHVGALKTATSRAISHHRRDALRACRDARLTVGLPPDVRDPAALEEVVCTRVVLAAFLRALTEPERRGLYRSAFTAGRLSGAEKSNAYHARVRLRALQEQHG